MSEIICLLSDDDSSDSNELPKDIFTNKPIITTPERRITSVQTPLIAKLSQSNTFVRNESPNQMIVLNSASAQQKLVTGPSNGAQTTVQQLNQVSTSAPLLIRLADGSCTLAYPSLHYKCNFCELIFDSEENLKQHQSDKHSQPPGTSSALQKLEKKLSHYKKCPMCFLRVQGLMRLRTHFARFHPYDSLILNSLFDKDESFSENMADQGLFSCPHCKNAVGYHIETLLLHCKKKHSAYFKKPVNEKDVVKEPIIIIDLESDSETDLGLDNDEIVAIQTSEEISPIRSDNERLTFPDVALEENKPNPNIVNDNSDCSNNASNERCTVKKPTAVSKTSTKSSKPLNSLFSCHHCHFTSFLTELSHHVRTKHNELNKYHCISCDFTSPLAETVAKHEKMHALPRCEYCFYYSDKFELDVHFDKNHVSSKSSMYYQVCCVYCNYKGCQTQRVVKQKSLLRKHFISEHYVTCGDMFERGAFEKHVRWTHLLEVNVKKCSFCDFYVKDEEVFKIHLGVHFKQNNELIYCVYCNYFTDLGAIMHTHLMLKHRFLPKTYHDPHDLSECKFCHMVTSSGRIVQHLAICKLRVNGATEKAICPHCGAIHLKTHFKDDGQMQCFYCETNTKLRNVMQLHVDVEHIQKNKNVVHMPRYIPWQITCPHCKLFGNGNDRSIMTLCYHVKKIHNTNTLYHCMFCDYTNTCSKTLAQHESKHNQAKQCKYCFYKSFEKETMDSHLLEHHLKGALKCVYCDFKLTRTSKRKTCEPLRNHFIEEHYSRFWNKTLDRYHFSFTKEHNIVPQSAETENLSIVKEEELTIENMELCFVKEECESLKVNQTDIDDPLKTNSDFQITKVTSVIDFNVIKANYNKDVTAEENVIEFKNTDDSGSNNVNEENEANFFEYVDVKKIKLCTQDDVFLF